MFEPQHDRSLNRNLNRNLTAAAYLLTMQTAAVRTAAVYSVQNNAKRTYQRQWLGSLRAPTALIVGALKPEARQTNHAIAVLMIGSNM